MRTGNARKAEVKKAEIVEFFSQPIEALPDIRACFDVDELSLYLRSRSEQPKTSGSIASSTTYEV